MASRLTDLVTPLASGWILPPRRSVTVCAPFDPDLSLIQALPGTHRYMASLQADRVAQARAHGITAILSAPWDLAPHSHRVSLLWLNPPTDPGNGGPEPASLRALRQFTPWAHPQGWILALLPQAQLLPDHPLGHWIDQHWTLAAQWDVSGPIGEATRLLLAQPRQAGDAPAGATDAVPPPWDPTVPIAPQWRLPTTTPWRLTSLTPHPDRFAQLGTDSGFWDRLRAETVPLPNLSTTDPITTPTPLHLGHLATLLTAGRLTGTIGTGPERHLVKGRVIQHIATLEDSENRRIRETRYRVELHTLHPDGTLHAWVPPVIDPALLPVDEDSDLSAQDSPP